MGAAYIMPVSLDVRDFRQTGKLIAANGAAEDLFGYSVSVAGNVALIGACYANPSGDNSGAAYVFERIAGDTNNWRLVKKLTASDGVAWDRFGISVSMAGDVALVGASTSDPAGAGAAYMFKRNAGGINAWGQVQKLTAADGAVGDYFGMSVSVDGNVAFVGACGYSKGSGVGERMCLRSLRRIGPS